MADVVAFFFEVETLQLTILRARDLHGLHKSASGQSENWKGIRDRR
jgi:hypothetical protein